MAEMTLILGGARSGKTARALALTPAPRVYIATAEAGDKEMAARIAAHKAERAAGGWDLIEAPRDLAAALGRADARAALVDCLTLWLSNLMADEGDVAAETEAMLVAARAAPGPVIFVTNEIGLGLSPMNALGRAFRDEQGRLNQRVAAAADRVEFVAAGLPLRLK